MAAFRVLAHWDEEARAWWAESVDIKGLVGEADTLEGLVDGLKGIVPDLLQLNHGMSSETAEIQLLADRTEGVRVPG
jgi:hypothetical protein